MKSLIEIHRSRQGTFTLVAGVLDGTITIFEIPKSISRLVRSAGGYLFNCEGAALTVMGQVNKRDGYVKSGRFVPVKGMRVFVPPHERASHGRNETQED